MSKKIFALLLAVVMILSLAACGASSEPAAPEAPAAAPEAPAEPEVDPEALRAANGWYSEHYDAEAMKGVSLNMYGVTDAIIPVLDAFYEDTGITVENLTLKNGEILERIKNEHEAGTVNADIWFTGGADAFISASEQGLLIPYASPEAAALGSDMKDANGYWAGTSMTVVNWVVNLEVCKDLEWSDDEKLLVNIAVSEDMFFNGILDSFNSIYQETQSILDEYVSTILLFPEIKNKNLDSVKMKSNSAVNLIARTAYFNTYNNYEIEKEITLRDIPKHQRKNEIIIYCQTHDLLDSWDIANELRLETTEVEEILEELVCEGIIEGWE